MKRFFTIALILLLVLTGCNQGPAPEPDNNQARQTLRVAMECTYAPFNWSQEDDSNEAVAIADSNSFANGFDVSIARRIAEAYDYDLEIVRLDWDSLVPAVQSGEVDAAIAGQSITAERLEVVDFSDPYYYASIVVLTKSQSPYAEAETLADLAGGTATSQLGTVWYNVCLPQIEDVKMLPAQETASSMLIALTAGTVDYVVCDLPTAMAATTVYPELVILDFSDTDYGFEVSAEEINLGISVQKGNSELLAQINEVLATISSEEREELMSLAISQQPLSED
ncbi:MAG: transporter substrate-binding domain-containing protein [Firmicutes bacterium]|nr:transporter substrate-binding domain-containing protein [Bacillota bacterium]